MEISTFVTRSKIEACRGRETHRWVQDELSTKVQDRGSWYPMTLKNDIDGYPKDQQPRKLPFTPVQNGPMQRVQDVEGGWSSALEGVTIVDLRVGEYIDMILGIKGVAESIGDFPQPRKIRS